MEGSGSTFSRKEGADDSHRAEALGHCRGVHPIGKPRAGAGDDHVDLFGVVVSVAESLALTRLHLVVADTGLLGADYHFVSDVLAGFGLGAAVGVSVAVLIAG